METAANAVVEGASALETTQDTTESAPVTAVPDKAAPESGSEPEWFKKRFDEITGRFRSEERRASAAEMRAMQLEQQLRQMQAPVAKEEAKTLADFEYDEGKYQSYLFQQAEKRAVEAARKARDEDKELAQRASRTRKFQEREVAFEKETKDYRDVAHFAPIGDSLAEIIQDMDSGPEIAYYLGKHRDVALSLNELPAHIAAVELGRIDARLTAEKAAKAAALEAAKAAKAVTQAPEPATRIDGGTTVVDKDPGQMTDAEFTKWFRKKRGLKTS